MGDGGRAPREHETGDDRTRESFRQERRAQRAEPQHCFEQAARRARHVRPGCPEPRRGRRQQDHREVRCVTVGHGARVGPCPGTPSPSPTRRPPRSPPSRPRGPACQAGAGCARAPRRRSGSRRRSGRGGTATFQTGSRPPGKLARRSTSAVSMRAEVRMLPRPRSRRPRPRRRRARCRSGAAGPALRRRCRTPMPASVDARPTSRPVGPVDHRRVDGRCREARWSTAAPVTAGAMPIETRPMHESALLRRCGTVRGRRRSWSQRRACRLTWFV